MTYIKEGPFIDNSAPGVDAVFLNNVENILAATNSAATDSSISSDGNGLLTALAMSINAKQVNINGSTSGNIVCYEPFVSPNFKIVIMFFNNYRNGAAGTQGVVIPVPFTQRQKVWSSSLPSNGVQFQKSGSAATIAIANTGTNVNQQLLSSYCIGEILGGWDTMTIPGGSSVAVSGVLLIIGW